MDIHSLSQKRSGSSPAAANTNDHRPPTPKVQFAVPSSARIPVLGVSEVDNAIFRQEGDFWTLSYAGKTIRLKDIKGLAYIAHLLSQPGTEVHSIAVAQIGVIATELTEAGPTPSTSNLAQLEPAGVHVGHLGDAGEMLDNQAKAAYRRRLAELREEEAEARGLGQVDRAEEVEREMEALMAELSRATGLGGRNRVAASSSERARQSVTRAIKGALGRIADHHLPLGQMLALCIKTGTYCSYVPDPNSSLSWQLTAPSTSELSPPEKKESSIAISSNPAVDNQPAFHLAWPSSLSRTKFVGREREVKLLRSVVDLAASDTTAVTILSGGPGVGKTRLATEVARFAAEKGFRCFTGRCHESGEPLPYLPFAEVLESMLERSPEREYFKDDARSVAAELAQIAPSLRRVFANLPPRLDLPEPLLPRFIFQGFAEFLARASRRSPLLILLDDLHWADEATLGLLNFLADQTEHMPLVLLGTYRDAELDSNPPLVRTLDELIRSGLRPLKLSGLSQNETAQMIRSLSLREPPLALVHLAYDETQGNPFFVEEIYKHLVEEGKLFDEEGEFQSGLALDEHDIPEHIRLVLGRRLQRLSEPARQVLTAAAVIGRKFSFELLQTVVGSLETGDLLDAIEQAQRMGFVASSEGSESALNFTHELVRQTLVSDISKPRYQRLHLAAAEAIEQLEAGRGNESAMEIADHLRKAGPLADAAKTSGYFALAGKNALAFGAYEEANRNFETAILYRPDDPRWKAECFESIEKALRGLGRGEEALRRCMEEIEIYRKLGDFRTAASGMARASLASLSIGRAQEAAEIARQGLAFVGEEPSESRADLLAVLGQSYLLAGNYIPAKEALTEAIALARQFSNPELLPRVLAQLCAVNETFLETSESMANSQASLELSTSDVMGVTRATALYGQMMALHRLGRIAEGRLSAAELQPLARKAGYLYFEAACKWLNAWSSFGRTPDLSRLEEQFKSSVEIARGSRIPLVVGLALAQLSLAQFYRGERAAALESAQDAYQTAIPPSTRGFAVGILFRELAYSGDHAGAMALLDRERGGLPIVGQPNVLGAWAFLVSAVEGLVALGEHKRAADFYPLVQGLLDTGVVSFPIAARFPQTTAGIAAAAARHWQTAEEHFRIALRQAQEIPDELERADVRRFFGSMLSERKSSGDGVESAQLLNEALADYRRMAMPLHVDIAKALLARI